MNLNNDFFCADITQPPSPSDIAGFRAYMNDVVAAFHLSYAQTQARLPEITLRTKNMNPVVRAVLPNYRKLNETRKQVSDEVQMLDKAISGQK